MITIDTCGTISYSPLIPAIKAMCYASPGDTLEVIMNNAEAFGDLKEYLSEQGIGFREIYDEERMTLQFTINKKFQ
ncbi:sulfurtransferase TusA family protein [Bacteroides sp.]|uniref:sulfurtransferase TusA family protein n=1 Tax=Bacteroides sp. TaxID=29523 RepID=UPI00261E054A|nr:sulfurtransferase TusA family protein [Bacteroides sp.]MDD3037534.1 sulfurtransferase TusA family protein [Bacteroides sp.]